MEENSNSNNNAIESLTKDEKPHQSLITFAKLNKYFLIPFLCPVFCMLANYLLGLIINTNAVKAPHFIFPVYIMFSYIAAGSLYFISYFNQKVEDGKENIIYRERAASSIRYIYNDVNKKNLLKEYILIIFLGFLVVIFELFSIFILDEMKYVFEERLYFLFFIPLFSKLILKEDILKHQYFSLIIAIIGISLVIIPVALIVGNNNILANILNLAGAICYSLFLVLIKYITHTYYISPLKMSFIFGLISVGFIFFGFMIYSLIEFGDLSYFKDSLDFSEVDNKGLISLYIILCFIFATILQFLTLLVIFYFSPILLMVTDIISPMLTWIVSTIEGERELPGVVLNPIGYLIVLFSSLIYNEIIIFNFCGLSENTKKFVEIRLNEESKDLRKTENQFRLGSFRSSEADQNDIGEQEDRLSHSS